MMTFMGGGRKTGSQTELRFGIRQAVPLPEQYGFEHRQQRIGRGSRDDRGCNDFLLVVGGSAGPIQHLTEFE